MYCGTAIIDNITFYFETEHILASAFVVNETQDTVKQEYSFVNLSKQYKQHPHCDDFSV